MSKLVPPKKGTRTRRSSYLYDSLTGGERQPHEAGVVDGHDLISDAELAGASRRAAVHHVG